MVKKELKRERERKKETEKKKTVKQKPQNITHSMICVNLNHPLPQVAFQISSMQANILFFFSSMFLQPLV